MKIREAVPGEAFPPPKILGHLPTKSMASANGRLVEMLIDHMTYTDTK